jgi:hypothetical protein
MVFAMPTYCTRIEITGEYFRQTIFPLTCMLDQETMACHLKLAYFATLAMCNYSCNESKTKISKRMVDTMTNISLQENALLANKIAAFEQWADEVETHELREIDTTVLKTVQQLADQRAAIELQLTDAVERARLQRHSWSEIGVMLGVSKQAAQRRYGPRRSAA